jgi:hypothetical protein
MGTDFACFKYTVPELSLGVSEKTAVNNSVTEEWHLLGRYAVWLL